MKRKHLAWIGCAGLVIALAACNGGGSSDTSSSTQSGAGASASAISSGVITAFGSVFVDGHEFSTAGAKLIDDDTGDTSTSTAGLEVGMVVDVTHGSDNSGVNPTAGELHVHPLARGYVDAIDATAGTLTVMGQTVQLTPATIFSDHRACVSANACAAVSGQSDLIPTSGSGATAVAGTFVTVHGYLFSSSAGSANIVATLVSAADVPTSATSGVHFKAEGVVTAATGNSVTIGALGIDLSSAHCYVAGEETSCAGAFGAGQVVSAYGATAPSLPAATFTADGARLSLKIPVDVSGTSMEIEGAVSSVTTSPAAFIMRGVNIDASALPTGTSLPAVGDIVRVQGAVAANGQSVKAASVTVLHAARDASYGFEGDVDVNGITPGTAINTYVLALLGQNITVTSDTRLADRSTKSWYSQDPASNPFNITTFVSYLQASASQHLIVSAEADASGNLTALSLTIVPAATVSGIAGLVDGSPAPFNSGVTGTPSTFTVHGLAISADPSAVLQARTGNPATVAAGDQVVVLGSFAIGTLTVTAPPSYTSQVIDLGAPKSMPMRGDSF